MGAAPVHDRTTAVMTLAAVGAYTRSSQSVSGVE